MFLVRVNFENIRNHNLTELFPSRNLNVIYGRNGSGKTSILEAISICAFSKSFVSAFDQNIVRYGKNYYRIEIEGRSENGLPISLQILFQLGKKKEIKSTSGESLSVQDLIGKVPVVVLSPEMREIIFGSPAVRREFIDRIISQTDQIYFRDLIINRRILKQRNKLLNDILLGNTSDIELFKIWTLKFIESSAEIIKRRIQFFKDFPLLFISNYQVLSQRKEAVNFTYQPFEFPQDFENFTKEEISKILNLQAESFFEKEISRGVTLFGPQKDDFIISFNYQQAKNVASQGQSKTILIALKYAEIEYLLKMKNTTPIVLFDDIFSELDKERVEQVLKILSNNQIQFFITTTELDGLKSFLQYCSEYKIFYVENGSVREDQFFFNKKVKNEKRK